jgi:hypothetical protein
MGKIKITHSFEREDGEFCIKCDFAIYNDDGDFYYCICFNKVTDKKVNTDGFYQAARIPECISSSVPIGGDNGE